MASTYDKVCVSKSNLLIFLNIVVHVGMFHSHVIRQVHILFYFNCFIQHILVHCCLYFTADVIKCGALFYIRLITTIEKISKMTHIILEKKIKYISKIYEQGCSNLGSDKIKARVLPLGYKEVSIIFCSSFYIIVCIEAN